jgi:outer membrane lipoprotein carrier protein
MTTVLRSTMAAVAALLLLPAAPRTGVAQQSAPAAPRAPSAADSAAMSLLERASAAYASARTLQATFLQTLVTTRTGAVQSTRGTFRQRGTTQFAFDFTEPAGDRIVADGDALWIYMPSAAPGQALKVPRAAGAGLDFAASLLRAPRERYNVRALADTVAEGSAVRRLTITPRTADAPFRTAEVWIDTRDTLIRRVVIAEPLGLVRTIDFTRVRVGEELPADAFVFTPPPGVRVLDQAALFGGSVPPRKP